MALTATQSKSMYQFFALAFNAAPGVTYMNQLDAAINSGMSVTQVVEQFTAKAEFTNVYPNFLSNEAFATKFITNNVGSNASAAAIAEAIADVTAALNAGWSRGKTITQVFTNITNLSETDATWGNVVKSVNNKVAYAQYYTETLLGGTEATPSLAALRAVIANVTPTSSVAVADMAAALNPAPVPVAQTFTLTAGVDTFTGGAGNDAFIAAYDSVSAGSTLTILDQLDGGAGTDTLSFSQQTNAPVTVTTGAKLSNIEVVTLRAGDDLEADFSGANVVGLETVSVLQAVDATITAGKTTAVSIAGATGVITVDGGSSATVAAATAAQGVTIGATTVGAGAVAVTHTNQTTGVIAIDGGTTVAVTASKATTGTVNVGQSFGGAAAATDLPSGAVTVTTTGAAYAAGDVAAVRGAINVKGGTAVTVTQTASSSTTAAETDTSNAGNGVTQSAVTITGGTATTSVTVAQSAAVTAVDAVIAVAGVKQIDKVTFIALAATESVTVGGLTFTAAAALTAAQVAAAFANLSASATAGSAPASQGIYSGTFGAYTTGAVTTASSVSSVEATASAAATGTTAIVVSDTATANIASVNTTAGVTAVTAVTGKMGVVGGLVRVTDANFADPTKADSITTASLDGYAANSYVQSDALTTLSLANSAGAVAVHNNTATTLGLTLNKVTGAVNVDSAAAKYTTLNVTTAGTKSATALTAAATTALNVSGDVALDLTGSTLSALKTVTVSGAAGLTVNASGTTVTAVNTTASTGTNVITVDATKATYTGGAGVDTVTLSAAAPTKAVSLGAGDDSITLADGTTSLTGSINGGDGTDTLVMLGGNAATASATGDFELKIDGIEKLEIKNVTNGSGAISVNLANMDDISYVVSNGIQAAELGTTESAVVTFQALKSGQVTQMAGLTVVAGADLTAAQVEAAVLAGATTGNAVVSGQVSGWAVSESGTATDGQLKFTANVAGNATDLAATQFNAAAPMDLAITGKTAAVPATVETTVIAFSPLLAGESTVVTDGNDSITISGKYSKETAVYDFETSINHNQVSVGDIFTIAGYQLEVHTLGNNATNFEEEFAELAAAILSNKNDLQLTITASNAGNGVLISPSQGSAIFFTKGNISQEAQLYNWTHSNGILEAEAKVAGPTNDLGELVFKDGNTATSINPVITQAVGSTLTAVEVAALVRDGADGTIDTPNANATVVISGDFKDRAVQLSTNTVTFSANGNADNIYVENSGFVTKQTDGVDAVGETNTVAFTALKSGQSATVAGYTYTAPSDKTAAEVATAFANKTAGQNSLTGWNSGAATDNSVTFTSTTLGADVADITFVTNLAQIQAPVGINTTQGGVGAAAAGSLTFTKMANNGTLELKASNAETTTITMADATGSADSFNIVTKVNAANIDFGTVSVAGVETVNITATDTTPVNATTGAATISKATLNVTNTAVKAIVVTGNSDLDLTAAGASLKTVNAADLTGALTFTSSVDAATLTGGSGADYLVGNGNNQTLVGGAGADTLVATGDLAVLTGGAGADVFSIGNATSNVNAYATITDFTAGDSIKFSAASSDFIAAKVTLGATAVFQDLANAAIANSDGGDVAWFQHGVDTYVIENVSNDASTFINGTDIIVKITGLVDLSTASFSASADTLLIAAV